MRRINLRTAFSLCASYHLARWHYTTLCGPFPQRRLVIVCSITRSVKFIWHSASNLSFVNAWTGRSCKLKLRQQILSHVADTCHTISDPTCRLRALDLKKKIAPPISHTIVVNSITLDRCLAYNFLRMRLLSWRTWRFWLWILRSIRYLPKGRWFAFCIYCGAASYLRCLADNPPKDTNAINRKVVTLFMKIWNTSHRSEIFHPNKKQQLKISCCRCRCFKCQTWIQPVRIDARYAGGSLQIAC